MNKFIEFCIKNKIQFSICDNGCYDDENPSVNLKEIEIDLFKYRHRVEKRISITELRDEGLNIEDICLDFAKDFNDFCEKVGE